MESLLLLQQFVFFHTTCDEGNKEIISLDISYCCAENFNLVCIYAACK